MTIAIRCAEFAAALAKGSNELWHPVKERGCVVQQLGLGFKNT